MWLHATEDCYPACRCIRFCHRHQKPSNAHWGRSARCVWYRCGSSWRPVAWAWSNLDRRHCKWRLWTRLGRGHLREKLSASLTKQMKNREFWRTSCSCSKPGPIRRDVTAVDLEVLLLPFMGQPYRPDDTHVSDSLASACGALFASSTERHEGSFSRALNLNQVSKCPG